MMLRRRLVSIALAAAAGGLLAGQPAAAQKVPFPKRCDQHAAKPSPQTFLKEVNFVGVSFPEGASQKALVARMRRQALTAGPKWLTRVWSEVRAAWQDRGYFQAVVSIKHHVMRATDREREVALTIHVDPGPQYRTYLVRVRNANPGKPLAYSDWKLRAMISLHPGQILSVKKLREGLAALRNFYFSKGYLDFTATPGFQIDSRRDRVSLNIFLDEGRQYRVGRIEVLGLGSDLKSQLEAEFRPGKVFNWTRVLDFYQTQKQMLLPGLSPADDRIYPDAKTGKVVMILDFRACPQGGKKSTESGSRHN